MPLIAPLLDPKFVLHRMEWEPIFQHDLRRIAAHELQRIERPTWPVIVDELHTFKKNTVKNLDILLAVDIETDGQPFGDAELTMLGISNGRESYVFTLDYLHTAGEIGVPLVQSLFAFLRQRAYTLVLHNCVFDLQHLNINYNFQFHPLVQLPNQAPTIEDTMLMHLALYAHYPHNLGFLASCYTDLNYYKEERHSDELDDLILYNAKDTWATWHCYQALSAAFKEHPWAVPVYQGYLQRTLERLLPLVRYGVVFHSKKTTMRVKEIHKNLIMLQDKITVAAGEEVNPLSTPQKRAILFDKLHLPATPFKTEKLEEASVGQNALRWLMSKTEDKLVRELLDAFLTYAEKHAQLQHLTPQPSKRTGRIHANFHYGPLTGRLACSDPNLMNITEENRMIAGALWELDYKQLETWIRAILFDCYSLLAVLQAGRDDHTETMIELFGKNAASDFLRWVVKRAVHGGDKGGGSKTIAREMQAEGVDVSEAQVAEILLYRDKKYPELKVGRNTCYYAAMRQGYVKDTIGGKRLYVAQTTPVTEIVSFLDQAGAASIMDQAWDGIPASVKLLVQLHDAFILDGTKQDALRVKQAMEAPKTIKGKPWTLKVEIKKGTIWNNMKKVNL